MERESSIRVFPEEIWGIIFEFLEDSRDILNTMRAFPEMDKDFGFQKKKAFWLFDQIIPQLPLWLSHQELLNCRMVSRRWCTGVDNILEHHHPSKMRNQMPWQVRKAKVAPLYDHLPRLRFTLPGQLTEFLEDIKHGASSTIRSPFVGRAVTFEQKPLGSVDDSDSDTGSDTDSDTDDEDNRQRNVDAELHIDRFWNSAIDVLRKVGEHVWFIQLSPSKHQSALSFQKALADCLAHLPNLKHLVISGIQIYVYHLEQYDSDSDLDSVSRLMAKEQSGWSTDIAKTIFDISKGPMRRLRRLENIVFKSQRYPDFKTRRTLAVMLSMSSHFLSKQYLNCFPNLKTIFFKAPGSRSAQEPMSLTIKREAPNVISSKLRLESWDLAAKQETLFQFLKHFTSIHHLELLGRCRMPIEKMIHSIPSIKTLVVVDDYRSGYDFLMKFPSLEWITISSWRKEPDDCLQHGDRLRGYLQDLLDSHNSTSRIWIELPKLKSVTIIEYNGLGSGLIEKKEKRCFTRSEYEHGEKKLTCGFRRDMLRLNYKQ